MSERMSTSQIRSKFYHVLNHCDNMEDLMPVLDALEDDHNRAREAEVYWKDRGRRFEIANGNLEKENAEVRVLVNKYNLRIVNSHNDIDDAAKSAMGKIAERCKTGDLEGNGCQLDRIMGAFLHDIDQFELENAYKEVECWRA